MLSFQWTSGIINSVTKLHLVGYLYWIRNDNLYILVCAQFSAICFIKDAFNNSVLLQGRRQVFTWQRVGRDFKFFPPPPPPPWSQPQWQSGISHVHRHLTVRNDGKVWSKFCAGWTISKVYRTRYITHWSPAGSSWCVSPSEMCGVYRAEFSL